MNKLKDYSSQPDPEVWNRIEKTLRKRAIHRQMRSAAVAAVVVAGAIVAVVNWPATSNSTVAEQTAPLVADAGIAPQMNVEPIESEALDNTTAVEQQVPQPNQDVQPRVVRPVAQVENTVESAVTSQAVKVEPVKPIASEPVRPVRNTVEQVEDVVSDHVTPTVAENAVPAPSVKASSSNAIEDTILWIPNVFAPMSDDDNLREFRVRLNKVGETVTNFKMSVFNRGGQRVFYANNISQTWDGTYKGVMMPQGAYVYVIQYTDKDKMQHQRKGTVTLLR